MEVDGNHIVYGIIAFMVVTYLLYHTACENSRLKKDDKTKNCPEVSSLLKKGAKAFGSANNIESINFL